MISRRTHRRRLLAGAAGAAAATALAAAALGATSAAIPAASSPCIDHPFTQPGKSVFLPVTVPPGYTGTMYRPADTTAYPGHRPAIVLAHGNGGNQCALAWAARLLSAHGYVTLTFQRPTTEPNMAVKVAHQTLAMKQAAAYLRSPSNPWHAYIDADRLGLAGHSLGALASSAAQSGTPSVRAIVALDNLVLHRVGSPAAALACPPPPSLPVVPKVPALGLASDRPCIANPTLTDKLEGYHGWKAAGQPTMELIMRNFAHNDFTGQFQETPATAVRVQKLRRAGFYLLAWFDRWLAGKTAANQRLLAHMPLGVSPAQMFSSRPAAAFRSAAFIPGVIDCDDLVTCL